MKVFDEVCIEQLYTTRLSRDDCVGRLGRRNIYDNYEYEYMEDEGIIRFLYRKNDDVPVWHERSDYQIWIWERDGLTYVRISLLSRYPLPYAVVGGLSRRSLERFFGWKLDAELVHSE